MMTPLLEPFLTHLLVQALLPHRHVPVHGALHGVHQALVRVPAHRVADLHAIARVSFIGGKIQTPCPFHALCLPTHPPRMTCHPSSS